MIMVERTARGDSALQQAQDAGVDKSGVMYFE